MDETKKGFMQNIGDLSFKKIDEANFEYSIKIFGIVLILFAVIFSQLAPIYGKKYYGRN